MRESTAGRESNSVTSGRRAAAELGWADDGCGCHASRVQLGASAVTALSLELAWCARRCVLGGRSHMRADRRAESWPYRRAQSGSEPGSNPEDTSRRMSECHPVKSLACEQSSPIKSNHQPIKSSHEPIKVVVPSNPSPESKSGKLSYGKLS